MEITEDMLKYGTVFHCDTKKKVIEFCEKLSYLDYKWWDRRSYLNNNYYSDYKENACYCLYDETSGGRWDNVNCYKNDSYYTIIEYELDEYELDETDYKALLDKANKHIAELEIAIKHLQGEQNKKKLIPTKKMIPTKPLPPKIHIVTEKFSLKIEDILWYREEEDKITEMTMEEVCKKLGENIKIVK